jgi:hypothetical protein
MKVNKVIGLVMNALHRHPRPELFEGFPAPRAAASIATPSVKYCAA